MRIGTEGDMIIWLVTGIIDIDQESAILFGRFLCLPFL